MKYNTSFNISIYLNKGALITLLSFGFLNACIEQNEVQRDPSDLDMSSNSNDDQTMESTDVMMGEMRDGMTSETDLDPPQIDRKKIDFLFVIDDSSSMNRAQRMLSQSFKGISEILLNSAGDIDYRIAVTSTSIENINAGCSDAQAVNGQFIYRPVSSSNAVEQWRVETNRELLDDHYLVTPPTHDCDPNRAPLISPALINDYPINDLPPAPDNDPNCIDPESSACLLLRRRQLLEHEFKCRAYLGTNGCSIEKGLEAMRLALSCQGPNAELFGSCCVENEENGQREYNPQCRITETSSAPEFLRPDASLVVVMVSDENDCSTPQDNPLASSRVICQPGWNVDQDDDGIPDLYLELCGTSAAECFQNECGSFAFEGAEECHQKRCEIEDYRSLGCEYAHTQTLVSIDEYQSFLEGLKVQPHTQLLFVPLVGLKQYLRDMNGNLVVNDNNQPYPLTYAPSNEPFECIDDYTPTCCPDGVCQTESIKSSCLTERQWTLNCSNESDLAVCQNFCDETEMFCNLQITELKSAVPGTRYLDLANALGTSGLMCSEEAAIQINEGRESSLSLRACINLCEDSLDLSFEVITHRINQLINP